MYYVHDHIGARRGIHEFAEDAAQQIAIQAQDKGWTIRANRRILWLEDHETQRAVESFDHVAQTVYERETAFAVIAKIPTIKR